VVQLIEPLEAPRDDLNISLLTYTPLFPIDI